MNKVRRVKPRFEDPQFPQWENPQGPVGFIVGTLLWILMLIGFLFLFYLQLFNHYSRFLLQFIKKDLKPLPFWFSLLMVIFLFPVTLAVILVGALVKILQD